MNELGDLAGRLGIPLDEAQLSLFERFYMLLLDWNRRLNLTRITERDEVVVKHFLDSLTCLLVLPQSSLTGLHLIDVGSGAGLPGLPLKIARPELQVTLLESSGKKTAFLEEAVTSLGLSMVNVVTGRAEDIGRSPAHRERYDIAVARAVATLATLVEYCLPLLKVKGRMIAQKTAAAQGEIAAGQMAAKVLGGKLTEAREVVLPGLDQSRVLVVVEKAKNTPVQYPRHAGLPARSPLG